LSVDSDAAAHALRTPCEFLLVPQGHRSPGFLYSLSAADHNYGDVSPVPQTAPLTPGACTHPVGGYPMPARPYPRVGRHRTATRPLAEMRRKGCPAGTDSPGTHPQDGCGAASRGGPGDLDFCAPWIRHRICVRDYLGRTPSKRPRIGSSAPMAGGGARRGAGRPAPALDFGRARCTEVRG